MMNEIQIFNNPDFGEIRTIMIDGEPWFVGRDVATSLGYEKQRNAIQKHVDADDALKWGIEDALGRKQETTVINESGLYSLIFGSKLESAKKYKRVDSLEDRFNEFEKSLPLLPNEADEVSGAVKKRVVEILGGKESNAYRNRGICQKAFKDAYRELKRNFDCSRYKDIKREQKDKAVELAGAYVPPLYLKEQIEQANAQMRMEL